MKFLRKTDGYFWMFLVMGILIAGMVILYEVNGDSSIEFTIILLFCSAALIGFALFRYFYK